MKPRVTTLAIGGFQPDWRWRGDADVSRWYPTMRLFRQQSPGDWDEVIGRVAAALAHFAESKEVRETSDGGALSDAREVRTL